MTNRTATVLTAISVACAIVAIFATIWITAISYSDSMSVRGDDGYWHMNEVLMHRIFILSMITGGCLIVGSFCSNLYCFLREKENKK